MSCVGSSHQQMACTEVAVMRCNTLQRCGCNDVFGGVLNVVDLEIMTAVKAAPTPLPSNTVLRTNSESKLRYPEQPEA